MEKSMNYIEKLSEEELERFCNFITGKVIRKYFQDNPKKFKEINLGIQQPIKLKDEIAIKLIIMYRKKEFISSFINKQTSQWIDKIEKNKSLLIEEGKSSATALLLAFSETGSQEWMDIYFKLTKEINSEEYSLLIKEAIQLLSVKQKAAVSNSEYSDKNMEYSIVQKRLFGLEKEKEALEKKYKQDIEKLRKDAEKEKKVLTTTKEELEMSREEIKSLEKELTKLHQLDQKAVYNKQIIYDETYPFISLCMITRDSEGKFKLNRLSDVEEGIILGHYLPDYPIYNKLYMKEVPASEGFVGVWSWKIVPLDNDSTKNRILSVYQEKYIPTELVFIYDCETINKLLEQLKKGIVKKVTARRIIFAYQNENKHYEGVFCTSKDLDISECKVKLKSDIFSLPVFLFTDVDIFSFNERIFHRRLNLGRPSQIILVKDPLEITKDILVKRVTRVTTKQKGFTKSEYQKFKDFFVELPSVELYKEISEACECNKEQAEVLVKQLVQNAADYLDACDLESETLSCLIRNHSALMESCKNLVEKEWQMENNTRMKEAKESLELIKQKISEQSKIFEDINAEYAVTQEKLNHALVGLEQQESLADDVERKVAERIDQARKNVADFIVNTAFIQPFYTNTISQSSVSSATFTEGILFSEEQLELNEDWDDLRDMIQDNLLEAGVSEKYTRGLAGYLYAVYLNKVPLLLAGPCSEEIADAFCTALSGRLAGRLCLDGDYCRLIVEQCFDSKDQVVVIEHPFHNAWSRYLPEIFNDKSKFYIAVSPYKEDLLLEPVSLFSYVAPLLTEYFVDKFPGKNFIRGYKKFSDFCKIPLKPYYNKLFTAMKMAPFVRKLLQQLLTDMYALLDNKNADNNCIFVVLPYAYVYEKSDIFRECLIEEVPEKIPVSTELLSDIKSFFGEIE